MFKVCVGAIALLIWTEAFSAQIGVGIHTGASVANISNAPTNAGDRTGLTLGVLYETAISPFVGMQSELNYTQQGYTTTTTLSSGSNSVIQHDTVALDYLEIPLFLKVGRTINSIRPFAFAGPKFSINVQSEHETSVTGAGPTIPTTSNFSANLFNFAFDMGAGAEVEASKNVAVFLDARYSLGLTNLASNVDRQLRIWQIFGGAKFTL